MTLTWALGGSVCITFLMKLSSIQPSISPILREELAHVLPRGLAPTYQRVFAASFEAGKSPVVTSLHTR
jgi:hypothetical protein